ncbi:MAG: hypothetical protein OIN66_07875 [Candidatus Methanoperedens sp.]|nr:hypothetical protein [Candidatus Methanoperedens sp.]
MQVYIYQKIIVDVEYGGGDVIPEIPNLKCSIGRTEFLIKQINESQINTDLPCYLEKTKKEIKHYAF